MKAYFSDEQAKNLEVFSFSISNFGISILEVFFSRLMLAAVAVAVASPPRAWVKNGFLFRLLLFKILIAT